MGKTDDQDRREAAWQALDELEAAGGDPKALAARFNEAATALRETGQYKSDITRIARVLHVAQSPIIRREAADVLGAIAVQGGAYSATATTALAVALEGGAAADHPDSSAPDIDSSVRLRAAAWLGQVGRRAPEGPEAFNCFMALAHAAKSDPDAEVRADAVIGLGNIGKAKLATWGEDIVQSLLAARDEKFPAALKLIGSEVREISAQLLELRMRAAACSGGASPPCIN